jgi:heme-degrading monooxygenase HmoA
MFVLHVDLQVKPGPRSNLEGTFVATFQPAISAQEGFAAVNLLRSQENESDYRLAIAFESQALQQKWVASSLHQEVWPQIERHCAGYSVKCYDAV